MSTICLCFADVREKDDIHFFKNQLCAIANNYKRGVDYSVNWQEPIVAYKKDEILIANLLDSPNSNNCEMLLLPDGWYHNGYTNDVAFKERVRFIQDIACLFCEHGYRIEFYFGLSGTEPNNYISNTVKCKNLTDYLLETIGREGTDLGTHIIVVS